MKPIKTLIICFYFIHRPSITLITLCYILKNISVLHTILSAT